MERTRGEGRAVFFMSRNPALAGRNRSNLSRALGTMSRYGPLASAAGRRGALVPRAPYDRVSLDLSLTARRATLRKAARCKACFSAVNVLRRDGLSTRRTK